MYRGAKKKTLGAAKYHRGVKKGEIRGGCLFEDKVAADYVYVAVRTPSFTRIIKSHRHRRHAFFLLFFLFSVGNAFLPVWSIIRLVPSRAHLTD